MLELPTRIGNKLKWKRKNFKRSESKFKGDKVCLTQKPMEGSNPREEETTVLEEDSVLKTAADT